ncbi:2-oxoglutarate dehydrogenase E1 component [Minwuia thermotolerans]|uniref:2-oxoglutarate dehydrogenase E1 component n=1 Tax=Minwuia thermotolerans TaxID=2056226 RepID=A0A2M9FZR8_9PROT|nr:2-oxoglutarate dehydrogenase E1 component [Minwuia thermotolerans]PJK28945.1 2-oxoglutarate dehydrogenase E1 component [Minwuia thermotolerans]
MGSENLAAAFLNGTNSIFIEELYEKYLEDPTSVDESWAGFFDTVGDELETVRRATDGASWGAKNGSLEVDDPYELLGPAVKAAAHAETPVDSEQARQATLDSLRALMLIRAYRVRGHLQATLDPLGLDQPMEHPELNPKTYGFEDKDMDRPIFLDKVLGMEAATMREILEVVQKVYCGTLAVEYMHIQSPEQKSWIQNRIEGPDKEVTFTLMGKKAILNKIAEAEGFENFMNVKYTGTKRFGLDGGEALMPAMEAIIKRGGQLGVQEIILGMPHRGRLNVLTNVMGKPFRAVFSEFQGNAANPDDVQGSGDVKYHLGTSSDREFDGNKVHLSLTANPSHLEAVDPVVLGKARAKIRQLGPNSSHKVLPILMHGDAAFAGQGIVAECFGLSGLKGYAVGGTIHIIVNNQIGFTTSPKYSRSSPYPSDVGKMVAAPILHVNGDDPEAVVHAAKIATEFRQEFGVDVVLDMFCYRRHGHNEGDEPSFTQPLMYRKIASHPTTRQIYARRLVEDGVMTEEEADQMVSGFREYLEGEFEAANSFRPNKADWLEGRWSGLSVAPLGDRRGATAVPLEKLKEIGAGLTHIPENFNAHRTIKRLMQAKQKMFETGEGIDWATAEALAFGSLALENVPVRLSGQDSGRGTFSQRHSVLVDQVTEDRYQPLSHIAKEQATFEVIDSMLSEAAVLGFEYGFSLAEPNALVLWEAQFGDFANGAQVIIDQFLSNGEAKWLRMSGLVMLLPHGHEGQGPEHSSARLERYLQLCAEDNMQVANCTTPANYFHILRRQVHRDFRKPLILMTPKSLLRHKRCVSTLDDFSTGSSFHRVLYEETLPSDKKKAKTLILCSGKVYYDLVDKREELGADDAHILRIEQLYPYPTKPLVEELKPYTHVDRVIWCQEEPRNMGAWLFVQNWLEECFQLAEMKKVKRPCYVGRPPSASPATGLAKVHLKEQDILCTKALKGEPAGANPEY